MADTHHDRCLRMARKHLLPHLEFEPLTAKALVGLTGLSRSSVNLGLKALARVGRAYIWETQGGKPVWTVPGWHLQQEITLTVEQKMLAYGLEAPHG
jgi:hypothetical protein